MNILEGHRQGWLPVREYLELPQQGGKRAFAPLLCGERQKLNVSIARKGQELGEQGHLFSRSRVGGKLRLQLGLLDCRRIVAAEPGCSFELRDHRMQGAVLVVRRAEVAQSGVLRLSSGRSRSSAGSKQP